ncbi:MAG: adenylosuccinate lyase [Candidatus Micrarchaeota archaeon]|nr:adenylosuccinate lyase [Candidatus Micrarchaeota archaeon]
MAEATKQSSESKSVPTINKVDALSPLDGRYRRHTEKLAEIFSERGLIKYRMIVEGEYFLFLHAKGLGRRRLSSEEESSVRFMCNVTPEAAQIVKDIEVRGAFGIPATNHDVKAVEYYMAQNFRSGSLKDTTSMLHIGLTSEDTNNIAYALMLREAVGMVLMPAYSDILTKMAELATEHKDLPMLARTHGQAASPTTFGKEIAVFRSRLYEQAKQVTGFRISAKLNGATGNYNAQRLAFPDVDWPGFTREFIEGHLNGMGCKGGPKLKTNLLTTQIEPHDTYAGLFDGIRRLNTVLIDFNQDMWRYISDGWLKLKPVAGEVGSSTMPHKVNPINFETSEGNLGMANAMFEFFSRKLPISRLQRDLSDSTVERNFGTALGHSMIGYKELLNGLGKIAVNETAMRGALEANPQVLTEAVQTVLRTEGKDDAYERLKELSRGKELTLGQIREFVKELDIPEEKKKTLLELTPSTYLGIASRLVNEGT